MSEDFRTLGNRLARDLMAVGDEGDDKAHRVEFRGGKWSYAETSLGGRCEGALATFFSWWLRKHFSARIASMEQEIEFLRRYGNKDCTHMADQALARVRAGGEE